MPNTRERETVRALVSAFNVNNYDFNAVKTNFKLQSEGKKDYIVVSFEKSMDTYQCREYLDSIKRKIIREFYGIEESNDAEILDTAKLIFDVNSFPFYISDRDWSWDKQHGFKFVTPVDKGVIFNLKSHLAFSLKKDVQEDMLTYITSQPFDKKKYLWCGEFDNKELRKEFESKFLLRMKERKYENVPKNPLKIEGDSVYIKDVFDDARFIDSVTRRAAWRIGIDLGVGNDVDHSVMLLKDSIINSVYQSTKIIVVGFICASPLNREEASILIPLVLGGGGKRILTSEEALKLNYAFDGAVFYNLYDRTQGELSIDKSDGMYSIDFSNPEISHCVITKIIESSVINKDHELSIDPELRLRALSPEPPRTPPEQTGRRFLKSKGNRDSGLGDSPPQHSVACSSSGSPSSFLKQSQVQPRQGSERGGERGSGTEGLLRHLHNSVSLAVANPLTQINCIAVNPVVPGTSKSLSAQARTSTGGPYPPPPPLIPFSSPQFLLSVARPSSSKGADESGSATGNPYPLPPPPRSSLISLLVSGPRLRLPFARPSPRKGANESGSASTSAPNSLSFSGPRFQPYSRSTSRCSTDSGCPRSPGLLTNERSASVYSAESGYESRPSSTFTDTSNYENQEELTEKELIINKFLKSVKEIAAKKIEEKNTLTKEKIHEYIEGFAKLEEADKPYLYCISFDEEYFKGKESCAKSIFGVFKDNYTITLHSELNRCGLEDSDFFDYKNNKLYIKDINVIKKIADNVHMSDRKSSPEWTQLRAKAGANKCRTEPTHETLSKEEGLIKALLYRFNSSNYYRGGVHINFTLKNGKIVSLLGDHVNTTEYLDQVKNYIIEHDCGTEEVAKRVYNFGQFPCVFPSDFQRDKDGKIIIAYNIDDAIPNLKVHLIQDFRIQVEEEVVKKLEKMGVKEARKRIKESAYLATKSKNSDVWYVFFDSKRFQEKSKLFEEFKSIYVEAFKSRWKECGLDDSLVYYENDALYIKNAIDINVVKSIEKYEKEEYRKLQASCGYSPKEASCSCFPSEEVLAETPIAFNEGLYFLERDFGEDMDYEESFDRGNTGRKSLKRKSPSPEDEGSSRESSGSESSNSSSKSDRKNTERKSLKRKSPSPEEARDPPRSSFSDSDSELCSSLQEAKI